MADEADVQGIAGNPLRRPAHHRPAGETRLVLVMGPQRRQHGIGEEDVEQADRGGDGEDAPGNVGGVHSTR